MVESALPLDEEGKKVLRQALGGDFQQRTVPELGAGVRITTSAGQIDASASNLAREAARQVAAQSARTLGGNDAGESAP
jgi:hypothetical protein